MRDIRTARGLIVELLPLTDQVSRFTDHDSNPIRSLESSSARNSPISYSPIVHIFLAAY